MHRVRIIGGMVSSNEVKATATVTMNSSGGLSTMITLSKVHLWLESWGATIRSRDNRVWGIDDNAYWRRDCLRYVQLLLCHFHIYRHTLSHTQPVRLGGHSGRSPSKVEPVGLESRVEVHSDPSTFSKVGQISRWLHTDASHFHNQ